MTDPPIPADGQPLLWLANPAGFTDYARGVVG